MKKMLVIAPIVAVVSVVGLAVSQSVVHTSADAPPTYGLPMSIVGTWDVTADAPYAPHLFTFNADGTMISTNPTDVQVVKSNTNDSLGLGTWDVGQDHGLHYVEGTFEELNATADTHVPTDTLTVTFKIELNPDGTQFDGPAKVHLGSLSLDSHVHGTRQVVDVTTVDGLSNNDFHFN